MELVSVIEILTNEISYNKKTNVFSVKILGFMFVGNYKKSVRISEILDDIYASLGKVKISREEIYFLDFESASRIHGNTKLKNLNIHKKQKREAEEEIVSEDKSKSRKASASKSYEVLVEEDSDELEELLNEGLVEKEVKEEDRKDRDDEAEEFSGYEEREKRDERKAKKKGKRLPPSAPSPAPVSTTRPAPGGGGPSRARSAPPPPPAMDALAGPGAPPPKPKPVLGTTSMEPQPTVYDINMGLQYYSVMMEHRSYLFYVYFSHEELKIVDEEGKTIFKTSVKITTFKKEPPVLELRIEGEGFEVHPLFGKVEVRKNAVNPPVMIFSILPLRSSKKRKKKKEIERRFLNAYIDFEGKTISHTILSIIVQLKFFKLDLGPIHLNLSKKTALIVSFISILIAAVSLIYMVLSIDSSSSFTDLLGGFVPGLGSIIFIAIFLITLFKEGIYPLKEKISSFLNFDQQGVLIK